MTLLHLDSSPEWFPFAIAPTLDKVQFLKMSEDDYVNASFLDERMLSPSLHFEWLPCSQVVDGSASLTSNCNFIFHVSHCGSTLLSRLLGCHPQNFSLREPFILRQLSDLYRDLQGETGKVSAETFKDWTETFLKLWSRTFRSDQTALVKATSYASDMASYLLANFPSSRAILIYIQPEIFLQALLSGSGQDIRTSAEQRWRRLQRYLGVDTRLPLVSHLSPGECVAMSWLTEMLAMHATEPYSSRCLWMDFDQFLQHPETRLTSCLNFLGHKEEPGLVKSVCQSQLMVRYSKALQFGYDAQTRQTMLAESASSHGAEITRGMQWLKSCAEKNSRVELLLADNNLASKDERG